MHKTLEEMLKIQKERLKISMEWERDKKIVIPETSAIIKSILNINDKINNQEDTIEEDNWEEL